MAEPTTTAAPAAANSVLPQWQYDPLLAQGAFQFILITLIFLCVALAVMFILWKWWRRFSAPYIVTIIERVGKGEAQYSVPGRRFRDRSNNYMIEYIGVGFSPEFEDFASYLRTVRSKFLIFPQFKRGFTVYKDGDKLIPCKVEGTGTIVPVDYDLFNYMQWKIRSVHDKYKRQDLLMQLAPIIGLGLVVLAFIMGSLLWGQHVQAVAVAILDKSTSVASSVIAQNSQVLTPA